MKYLHLKIPKTCGKRYSFRAKPLHIVRQGVPPPSHPGCLLPSTYIFLSFLLFPGGRIDHGHHDGSAINALTDTVAFNKAVAKALEIVNKGK